MPTGAVIFSGVDVYDGVGDAVTGPHDVLVDNGLVVRISTHAEGAPPDTPPGAEVIDGRGHVLMPGLIDAHWHAAFTTLPAPVVLMADPGYLHIVAGRNAEAALLRGFTSVRDAGGPVFGLKRAIDEGVVLGPRIYPSGAFITQTAGHGDFRMPYEVPHDPCSHLCHVEMIGGSHIADGVDAVLRAARENLMLGASQLKVMAGGGVSSTYDPIDVTQYTEPEIRAAVDCAENWGTYVMVHAYTSRAVQQCLRAGVKCIDHGHLLDDETVSMIADHDAWWSLQPFLDDEDAIPMAPAQRPKQLMVAAGTDSAYELAKKYKVKLAWGTDTLFDANLALRQGAQLVKMARWFTPAEVLRMATSTNAQLLAMSGERNPYPGQLGMVSEGAIADLLLVNGNPLTELGLLADPANRMKVIMKGGQVVKNTL